MDNERWSILSNCSDASLQWLPNQRISGSQERKRPSGRIVFRCHRQQNRKRTSKSSNSRYTFTFLSRMVWPSSGMRTTIKKIVGHSGAMTLTERVYTHLDIQVLIDAINKIVGERENGKEKNKQKKADTDNAIIITHICFSYLYLFTLNLAT